jgi:hypothetical protein
MVDHLNVNNNSSSKNHQQSKGSSSHSSMSGPKKAPTFAEKNS